MKKINIGINGASGKMGQSLQKILKTTDHQLFIAVSKEFCADFSFSVSNLENVEKEILDQVDLWIDFSSPEGLEKFLSHLSGQEKPIVSGTTGLEADQFAKLKKYSQKSAVFWASNFSRGVWALRQALKALSSVSDFDVEVVETHHIFKKDNPGGTAKTLHQDLQETMGKKIKTPYGKRIGGVFGIHEVAAASQNELLKFEHTALNREVFAEGAVKAAEWLMGQNSKAKKVGLYSMDDMMLNSSKR